MFADEDTWKGGSYELAIELGERDDDRLGAALKTLWQHPNLEGCYLQKHAEPEDQARLHPTSSRLPLDGHLCGIATIPNGKRVACSTSPLREDNGPDWLYLGLPMGSLATAYPVGACPFNDGQANPWCEELDTWLSEIGRSLFGCVRFRMGLTGWDAGGDLTAAEIECDGVPEERWIGYLWPEDGRLMWHAPTRTDSPMTAP